MSREEAPYDIRDNQRFTTGRTVLQVAYVLLPALASVIRYFADYAELVVQAPA